MQSTHYQVQISDFVIKLPAHGELEASTSTPITLAPDVFEPQTLSWLVEDNTYVEAGAVVAIVDTRRYEISSQQEDLRIRQEDIRYQTKDSSLTNEAQDIDQEAEILVQEKGLAERFSLQDLTFISRQEIIESMRDREYIDARQLYNDWRGDAHEDKSDAQLNLIDLRRQELLTRFQQYQNVMDNAEIIAPHAGMFVLAKNPLTGNQEKYRPGDVVFPGNKIAHIPNLERIQAKVFVLESESWGLKVGQRVELVLDAFPNDIIHGTVSSVDSIAKSIERDNPLQYFETIIAINDEAKPAWRPGLQLQATIYALEKSQILTVPSQALFRKGENSYVLVRDGSDWAAQAITIGARSLAKTEVLSGLQADDIIALHRPDNFQAILEEL